MNKVADGSRTHGLPRTEGGVTTDSMALAITAWCRTIDALLTVDAALGQVPGAAEQSEQMTRAVLRMRAEGDRIIAIARAAGRRARYDDEEHPNYQGYDRMDRDQALTDY